MGQSSRQQMLLEVLDKLSLSVDSLREETELQNSNLEKKINFLSESLLGIFEMLAELAQHQERVAKMVTEYVTHQIVKEVFECPQPALKPVEHMSE